MKADSFAAFRDQFDAVVSEAIRPEQKVPSLCIDHELDFSEIDARLIRILKRMEPFGPQNMEPVFMTREVEVIDARILKEAHLRLRLRKGDRIFDTIGFNMAHKWIALQASEIDIAFQPMFNSWNGNTTIRLRLKDIKNSNGKSGTA
jgi:single-stranded-DNA-specific exonuclease